MSENYSENGGELEPIYEIPEINLGEEKISLSDYKEAKIVLSFQEQFNGNKVPKNERVSREDFSAFVGDLLASNPDSITERKSYTDVDGAEVYYEDIRLFASDDGQTFLNIHYLEDDVGYRHNVSISTPSDLPGYEDDRKTTSYHGGNLKGDKPWILRQDSPYHVRGEQFSNPVSAEEITALGDYIETKFGLTVPKPDPDTEN